MLLSGFDDKLSLRTPKKGLNLCLAFICQTGHFGNKNGLDLIGLMEGALLVWSEFAKGFFT